MNRTDELLEAILQELRSTNQPLGFHAPFRKVYIYANRQYADALWYHWDGTKNTHIPIEHHALTGIIEKLEIEEKEFRGKPDYKVNLHVKADRNYVIQSGLDTLFAKGLIYTLSQLPVEAFLKPITIAVEPGDTEQVLFCRIYNPETGATVFTPYTEPVNWQKVTQTAITKISQAHPSAPVQVQTAPPVPNKPEPLPTGDWGEEIDLSDLIVQIGVQVERVGWSRKQGSDYLQQKYGKKTRNELTDGELVDFLGYLKGLPSAIRSA